MAFTINFVVEGAIWRNARKRIEYVFVVDNDEIAKQVLPFYRRRVRVKLLGIEFVGTIARGRHGVGFSIFLPRRYASLWEKYRDTKQVAEIVILNPTPIFYEWWQS